jgi:acyl-CoA synthetase (NDP forming)
MAPVVSIDQGKSSGDRLVRPPALSPGTGAAGPAPELDISRLLTPRAVAVVGASVRESAAAHRVIRNLQGTGFPGAIHPVNPRYEEVLGLPCYPSLRELPGPVDVAFIAIAAEAAVPALEEAAACGIGAAIVNASGFADGGPEGAALQERLAAVARASRMALCGPNNMGFINVHDRVGLWTSRALPPLHPGPVALISQSGSVAIAIGQDERRIGLAYLVTAGNEAVCTAADYLLALVRDDRVRVVMLFLETVRNPALFARAALEAADRGKRIVALKVGRTESSRVAVAAHTGALSGDDAVYDAWLRRHGVIRADSIDEMIETAMLLSYCPDPPPAERVIAITVSGGEAALIADIGAAKGLRLAELAPKTVEGMRPAFPPFAQPRNPVDAWGLGWDVERFRVMFDALVEDPGAGVVTCAVDAPATGGADAGLAEEMARVCVDAAARTNKRIVFFNNTSAGGVNADVRRTLDAAGIPYLCGMQPALAAIAHWTRYRLPAPPPRTETTRTLHPERLPEAERFLLLSAAGIPMARCVQVASSEQAVAAADEIGYPVVVKGTAPALSHKTEHGLVRLGLADAASVAAAYRDLDDALRRLCAAGSPASVVVQPMVGGGLQLLLGVRNDPRFGCIVVAGLGGIHVEVLREVSLRIGPLDREGAREMLYETRAGRLLDGTRGSGPYDVDAAIEALSAMSRLGFQTRRSIAALEVNPLIVGRRGQGAVGVDVVMEPAAPETE